MSEETTNRLTATKMKNWLKENRQIAVTAFGFIALIAIYFWSWMPYPWPPQYWIKRVFVTPTFQCKDGTVTWAKSPRSFCGKHGGAAKKYGH